MSPFTTEWENEMNLLQEKLYKLPIAALTLAIHTIFSGVVPSNDLSSMKAKWQDLLQDEIEIPSKENLRELLLKHLTGSREQNYWSKSIDVGEDMATFTTLFNIRIAARFGVECWPLLIDPLSNGEEWIKMIHRNYGDDSVNTVPHDDTDERTMILNGDDQNLGIITNYFSPISTSSEFCRKLVY